MWSGDQPGTGGDRRWVADGDREEQNCEYFVMLEEVFVNGSVEDMEIRRCNVCLLLLDTGTLKLLHR